MKRVSWITWRIYLYSLPINIVVLLLAADHTLRTSADVAVWALVAVISHIAIAPLVSVGISVSKYFENWKADLLSLFVIGAFRGVVINICVAQFDLIQNVSNLYKIFNSMFALPEWFIGWAIFIESRRIYQREFQILFAKAMRQEQETHQRQSLLPSGESSPEELIARLQFITSNLASDIQKLLQRPDHLADYAAEASRIQDLIDKDLRPTSAYLWKKNAVTTPKISFWALVQISLLSTRLRVITTGAFSMPYLFIGLNGAFGLSVAFYQCALSALISLTVFGFSELVIKFRLLSRKHGNILLLSLLFFIPYLFQIFFIPDKYAISQELQTVLIGQTFLSSVYVTLLLAYNSYKVVTLQRNKVIANLQALISGDKYSSSIVTTSDSMKNSDYATYLHGEIQAGLTASSLLLQQAAKSGDSELANEALERAASLLNQDYTNISYTRMASPELKIGKIIAGWKGIADISISLPASAELEESVMRNSVTLIEEAIANSIRHSHATEIKVSGILRDELLTINIISNGDPIKKGKAGLGSKLFNDLTSEWTYASESGHNRLTFILINRN